jgi:DNA-binding response OmpR family regulator
MRVLIIEDNIDLAQLVAKRLAQSGFESDTAATIEQAERAIDTVEFAAIILDLGLSGQDGLVLLREMRERGDATPVLIVSARSAQEWRPREDSNLRPPV